MNRWRVLYGVSELGTGWTALPAKGGKGACFDTFHEAITYADRMARTVDVTLPHVDKNGAYIDGKVGLEKSDGYWWIYSHGDEMNLFERDFKSLGLALLAQHYKNQREK